MMKRYIVLTACLSLLLGCGKTEVDPSYPTVIKKLPEANLSTMQNTFALKNEYLRTSLNDFGFCAYQGYNSNVVSPPLLTPLTQSEAMDVIKNFVSKNPDATGIKNPNDLTFSQISFSSGIYYDGASFWNARSSLQKVGSYEVLNTQILFDIKNREMVICVGNWYPDIYIPNKFNLSQDKAKSLLIGKTVAHTNIGGEITTVKITEADLDKSTVSAAVIPVTFDDRIELHVIWQYNIPSPVFYIMGVDVMNGEILQETPTIIS